MAHLSQSHSMSGSLTGAVSAVALQVDGCLLLLRSELISSCDLQGQHLCHFPSRTSQLHTTFKSRSAGLFRSWLSRQSSNTCSDPRLTTKYAYCRALVAGPQVCPLCRTSAFQRQESHTNSHTSWPLRAAETAEAETQEEAVAVDGEQGAPRGAGDGGRRGGRGGGRGGRMGGRGRGRITRPSQFKAAELTAGQQMEGVVVSYISACAKDCGRPLAAAAFSIMYCIQDAYMLFWIFKTLLPLSSRFLLWLHEPSTTAHQSSAASLQAALKNALNHTHSGARVAADSCRSDEECTNHRLTACM